MLHIIYVSTVKANVQYPPEWWGYKLGFVCGGYLGAKSKKRKAAVDEVPIGKKKIGFAEEDQENLYNLVQVSNFGLLTLLMKAWPGFICENVAYSL